MPKPYPYKSFKRSLEAVLLEYSKDTGKSDLSTIHDFLFWLNRIISKEIECPKCKGHGHPVEWVKDLGIEVLNLTKKCFNCNGVGFVIEYGDPGIFEGTEEKID